jgi:hypothetical protein
LENQESFQMMREFPADPASFLDQAVIGEAAVNASLRP